MTPLMLAPSTPASAWRLAIALGGAVVVCGLAQASGTSLALPLGTAFVPSGFALMAVLARLGDTQPAARPLALVLLAGTVAALSMGSLALVVLHVVEPSSLGPGARDVVVLPGGEARLSFVVGLLALSAAATLLGLFRSVRQAVHDIIPIDPQTFSHALALSTAIAVTLLPLLPLFVLGKPPLPLPADALPPGSPPVAVPTFTERAFELGWFALATLVAAGPGGSRRRDAVVARLGLGWPGAWRLPTAAAIGIVLALVRPFAARLLAGGATPSAVLAEAWLPETLPWAPLVGLSLLTAIGTELTYRGFLQPRLGIVLTNLVLVAPLAWTSGWAGLFQLFAFGLVLGAVRLYAGTTSAWAAHLAFLLATAGGRQAGL